MFQSESVSIPFAVATVAAASLWTLTVGAGLLALLSRPPSRSRAFFSTALTRFRISISVASFDEGFLLTAPERIKVDS